VKQDN